MHEAAAASALVNNRTTGMSAGSSSLVPRGRRATVGASSSLAAADTGGRGDEGSPGRRGEPRPAVFPAAVAEAAAQIAGKPPTYAGDVIILIRCPTPESLAGRGAPLRLTDIECRDAGDLFSDITAAIADANVAFRDRVRFRGLPNFFIIYIFEFFQNLTLLNFTSTTARRRPTTDCGHWSPRSWRLRTGARN